MKSMTKIEFESWEEFGIAEEIDLEDLNLLTNGDSASQIRQPARKRVCLDQYNSNLYGQRPADDDFILTTCCDCGLVLKQQAYYDHQVKKHPIMEVDSQEVEFIGQDAKRRRFELSTEVLENFYAKYSADSLMRTESNDFDKITVKLRRNSETWAVVGF